MFRTNLRWIAPALVLALGVAGCDEGEPTTPEAPETSLTVLLTDAVGNVDKVWVQILEMYFQGEGGRTPLPYDPEQVPALIELTALATTPLPLLESVEFPAGEYQQLRIVIGNAVLLDLDGGVWQKGAPDLEPLGLPLESEEAGELHCPSCSQSGIKVKLAGDEVTVPEGEATMMLDFDVAQSFGHVAGKSGKWVMHPTIHGVVEEGVEAPAGAIEGTVSLGAASTPTECPAEDAWGLDDFVPTATTTTVTDADGLIERVGTPDDQSGEFSIGPLETDIYTLGFWPEVERTGHVLMFTEVVLQPADALADVDGNVVGGVQYTINAWTCIPVT